MAGLTPKLPLITTTTDGNYELIKTYKNLMKQNFKNLILTSPGERMMDTGFGVGIRNFLFELDEENLYSRIISTISDQVSRYMPFLIIIDISFSTPESGGNHGQSNNFLGMRIEYAIGPLEEFDILDISVPRN